MELLKRFSVPEMTPLTSISPSPPMLKLPLPLVAILPLIRSVSTSDLMRVPAAVTVISPVTTLSPLMLSSAPTPAAEPSPVKEIAASVRVMLPCRPRVAPSATMVPPPVAPRAAPWVAVSIPASMLVWPV